MWKHHLKINLRYLLRNKQYFGIQLFTLVIGLICALLVFFYVKYELSFDESITDHDNIYRITTQFQSDDTETASAMVTPQLAAAIQNEFEAPFTQIYYWPYSDILVEYQNSRFYEDQFFRVDSTFLSVIPLTLVSGSASEAFDNPYSILVSETTAEKYFGSEDPVEKLLTVNDKDAYQVTGVFKDIPSNTHFDFDFLAFTGKPFPGDWSENKTWLYFSVDNPSQATYINSQLNNVVSKYFPESIRDKVQLNVQAMNNIHLYSDLDQEFKSTGNLDKLIIFVVAGFLIVLIVCINYINLSTAKYTVRAKEIGIRKSFGASETVLFFQYLQESLLIAVISAVISVVILTVIDAYLPIYLRIENHSIVTIVLYGLLAIFTLGLISGVYPALYIAKLHPVAALNLKFAVARGTFSLRNMLIIVQLVISVTFVFMMIHINEQLRYVLQKENILDKKNTVVLDIPFRVAESWDWDVEPFKNELLRIPGVEAVSPITIPWEKGKIESREIRFRNKDKLVETPVNLIWVSDPDYIKLYGLNFIEGHGDIAQLEDAEGNPLFQYVLNEKAASLLGEDWLNAEVDLTLEPNQWYKGNVLGVVQDFHYQSLYQSIEPLVFVFGVGFSNVGVKLQNDAVAIDQIEDVWKKFSDWPMHYSYLDDSYQNLYQAENESERFLSWLTVIASALALIGLVGLVSYHIARRRKYVAVKKVLGATTLDLIIYLNKDYLKLSSIALAVSIPILYILYRLWARNFAYKLDVNLMYIGFIGLVAVLCMLLLTVFNSLKAAKENPVKYLRSE